MDQEQQKDFYQLFRDNCTCADSSCKTYGYQLKFLEKKGVDYTDVPSILTFLKDQPDARQGNVLTACKVYFKHVLKDSEKSD